LLASTQLAESWRPDQVAALDSSTNGHLTVTTGAHWPESLGGPSGPGIAIPLVDYGICPQQADTWATGGWGFESPLRLSRPASGHARVTGQPHPDPWGIGADVPGCDQSTSRYVIALAAAGRHEISLKEGRGRSWEARRSRSRPWWPSHAGGSGRLAAYRIVCGEVAFTEPSCDRRGNRGVRSPL
jgi:hypothetical protein